MVTAPLVLVRSPWRGPRVLLLLLWLGPRLDIVHAWWSLETCEVALLEDDRLPGEEVARVKVRRAAGVRRAADSSHDRVVVSLHLLHFLLLRQRLARRLQQDLGLIHNLGLDNVLVQNVLRR